MSDKQKGRWELRISIDERSLFVRTMRNRMAAHLHIAEGYVSRAFCIQPSDMYLKTRGRSHVAQARQLVMYLAHVELGLPLKAVGHRYHRHRSTAAHACRVTENRRDDPDFDDLVCELEALISLRGDPLFYPN